MAETARLATGVEMRLTGSGPLAVACVSGRQDVEVPGTWSASPRRLAVAHGRLDRPLPGIPGVWPHVFLRAVERARAIGATSILIPGALHGLALRAPWGRPLPLPRAGRFADFVAAELQRFRRGESA